MTFKVFEVVDGDTFKVTPKWKWRNQSGNAVRPIGYDTPEQSEQGFTEAKSKLTSLILGKDVEIKNVKSISYERLLCEVYLNGINIAEYFVDYKK